MPLEKPARSINQVVTERQIVRIRCPYQRIPIDPKRFSMPAIFQMRLAEYIACHGDIGCIGDRDVCSSDAFQQVVLDS